MSRGLWLSGVILIALLVSAAAASLATVASAQTPNCALYPWTCTPTPPTGPKTAPTATPTPNCAIYPWACPSTPQTAATSPAGSSTKATPASAPAGAPGATATAAPVSLDVAPVTDGFCDPSIAGAYEKYQMAAFGLDSKGTLGLDVAPPLPQLQVLALAADCTWALQDGTNGTWTLSAIQPTDPQRWGGVPKDAALKITFSGWPLGSGLADGPVQSSGYLWAISPAGAPPLKRPGVLQVQYEFNPNPCGPGNPICPGTAPDGTGGPCGNQPIALCMMGYQAADSSSPITVGTGR